MFLCFGVLPAFAQQSAELDPGVAARLRQQITNGSSETRRSALAEIRNLQNASASRIAVPALGDRDPIVRATAAYSIVFLPANTASLALIPLLKDRDEFVRREAAYALGLVGDPSAVPSLTTILRSDRILEVRSAAAVGLGGIESVAGIDALASILRGRPRDEQEFLRRSAARSIGQVAQLYATGNPVVVTPQNFLPEKFKDVGPGDSGAEPPEFKSVVAVLIKVLGNDAEADDTRREAAFALGAVGDARAVPTLQTFVSSADPYLAEIAREALLKIGRRGK